ncbi:MAG: hypothetical protein IKM25_01045 [Clostridia bacterium]|nr:hypothetical protein [Clostridia bacterium]
MSVLKNKFGNNLPFVVLLAAAFAVHLFLPLNWADDSIFANNAANYTLAKFLSHSARPISDAFTYIFAKWHFLWRIVNPFVLTAFAFFLAKLIPVKDENRLKINWFFAVSVVYPCMAVVDAGFIATTVNYMYPCLCALIILNILKKAFEGKKIAFWQYLISIPLTAYATNMQQLGAVMFLVFVCCVIYFAATKRFVLYTLFESLLFLGGIAFALYLNTVGENNRMVRETARYFPEFLELNVFQKAELGFSSTFYNLMMYPHFSYAAFLAFTGFICFCSFKNSEKAAEKLAGTLPVTATAVLGALSFVPSFSLGYKGYSLDKAVYNFAVIPYLIYIPVIAAILFSLYKLLGKTKFLAAFALLFVALTARMIMGFSPTVWASGQRTFFIMFITFIAISAMLIDTFKDRKNA